MDTELDNNKLYISPSEEMIHKYIDGKWVQFIRADVIEEMKVKTLSLDPTHESVFIVMNTHTHSIYGCFRNKEKAEKYTNNSPFIIVIEQKVI